MSESDVLLKVSQVSNEYKGNGLDILKKRETNQVLNQVSFDIKENEFFGLVGESGCGKSTLGKAILGLIDFQGTITVDAEKRTRKNKKAMARKVQAVFQDPLSALNPKKTIGYTLEEPLKIHGIGNKEERSKRVNEILELVGLESSYRNRYPKELSGGQRQRVCIGAALMLEPRLIIADEAISALDVSVGSQILNLLQEIHDKFSLSLLFISHNLNVVYYLCDRIAVMYGGNIVELGDAKSIYENPLHPYTKILLSAIPDINTDDWKKEKQSLSEMKKILHNQDYYQEIIQENIQENNRKKNDNALQNAGCCFKAKCPYRTQQCLEEIPQFTNQAADGERPHFVSCFLIDI